MAATTNYDPATHDALIADVRSGERTWREAVPVLRRWEASVAVPDERRRVAADLVVAAWESRDAASAVAAARRLGPSALPTYALPAATAAARDQADRELQGAAIQAWLSRAPQDWDARVQLALWQIDQGHFAQADTTVQQLAQDAGASQPRKVALLEVRGALAEARSQPLHALAIYQAVRTLAPAHAYANRAPAFLLSELGAPAAGDAYARDAMARDTAEFSMLEAAELAQQALGQSLRWAVRERDQRTGEGPARHAALHAVYARIAPLRAQLVHGEAQATATGQTDPAEWQAIARRLDDDEIVALAALGRYADVLARYEARVQRWGAAPYYVLSAAAGAHQFQRRSDLAVPLYEAALRDGGEALPVPSDVHVGLVFAYLDTARFTQAEALLRELEAATPAYLRLTPEAGRANPDRTQVEHLRALSLLYADRVAQARARFDLLVSQAPLHAGLRAGQAQVAQRQERPEHAVALYESLATDHPDDVAARAGHIGALQSAAIIARPTSGSRCSRRRRPRRSPCATPTARCAPTGRRVWRSKPAPRAMAARCPTGTPGRTCGCPHPCWPTAGGSSRARCLRRPRWTRSGCVWPAPGWACNGNLAAGWPQAKSITPAAARRGKGLPSTCRTAPAMPGACWPRRTPIAFRRPGGPVRPASVPGMWA
ncbi:hypothetical protein IMZ29_07875 [Achromobacter sp. GG226]|nr:hypothetical protein [Verticiella sp. GG226]MBU4610459.1 hypothetical protein [Verticiella sp. GG226]